MNTPALGHIGRYELLARLGAGGMGEVFLARVTGAGGFEKEVVIKRILPHLASDTGFVQRFIEEGKLVVKLRHAGIAQVLDMGEQEGVFFIAMEHVEGKDLGELMRIARAGEVDLPRGHAVFILQELLEALDYAHRATDAEGRPLGIIHRDISPSNIMVSTNGEVKLVDFGIARAAERLQHSTTGAIRGKYGYMSPQQAAGAELDGRSDLFSAGVVAWELLTGTRPFDGASDLLTLDRVRFHDPGTIQRVADVPEDLAHIIDRLLAKDPNARWPSAAAALEALRDYVVRTGELRGKRDLAAWVDRVLQTLPRALRDRPASGLSLDDVLKLGLGSDPGRARTATIQGVLAASTPSPTPAPRPPPSPSSPPAPAIFTPTPAMTPTPAVVVGGTGPWPDPAAELVPGTTLPGTAAPALGSQRRRPSFLALLVVLNLVLIGAVVVLIARLSSSSDSAGDETARASESAPDAMLAVASALDARRAMTAGTEVASAPADSQLAASVPPSDAGPDQSDALPEAPGALAGRVVGGALEALGGSLLAEDETLVIRTTPRGASVIVSGLGAATAPRTVHARHGTQLSGHASLAGYETRPFSAVVGDEPTLSLVLREAPRGSVQFRFFPASARVLIDGRALDSGGSNLVTARLPLGEHDVVVIDPSGKRVERKFRVDEGKMTNLGTLDVAHGG